MKFTTHLELQSQTTRLLERTSDTGELEDKDGIITLYDTLFQGTYSSVTEDSTSLDYNAAD